MVTRLPILVVLLYFNSTAYALPRDPTIAELVRQYAPESDTESVRPHPWGLGLQLKNGLTYKVENNSQSDADEDPEQNELAREKELLDQVILADLAENPVEWTKDFDSDIPLASHPWVDTYVNYFTGNGRWFFTRWLQRSERYIPLMQPILEQHQLPKDLVFVAMVESGFVSSALSSARASGFWQFMPSTGKMYGLNYTTWIDDRRDYIRATHSAARYLKDLYKQFGDWHLAWAAYNAGGGKISRALARTGAKTFWQLVEHKGALPKETQMYVPKIIAAAIVTKQKERFGFVDLEALPAIVYDEVNVDDAIDLRLVAEKLEVPLETMHDLNPSLIYDITPPGQSFTLRVPVAESEPLSDWLASLPKSKRLSYSVHTIQRGDTLSQIAKRYRTSMTAIRDLNRTMDSRKLRPGTMLIVPSLRPAFTEKTGPRSVERPKSMTQTLTDTTHKHYKVEKGDTLWSIAKRYNTDVSSLKRLNHRTGNQVLEGESLLVRED